VDLHALSSYQYHLPEELIAQEPCSPRDCSRLMVVERSSGNITEMRFRDLVDFLDTGDQLIFNNTKVIPARLLGIRESGGAVEIFLLKRLAHSFENGWECENIWECIGRPGRKLRPGTRIIFGEGFSCKIMDSQENGNKVIRFDCNGEFEVLMEKYGRMPLPPYIKRDEKEKKGGNAKECNDTERYQTVYAEEAGAVAAPTAGLHFTEELLQRLSLKGIAKTKVTLHVGLGTFRPVQVEDIRAHPMHTEFFSISEQAALSLNLPRGNKRRIAVGTTSLRSLESAATPDGKILAGSYETDIFIYPGYRFKYVDSLITNFHLPGSTLLMLVCALAGYELTMEAYAKAVKERYRFFSYGDAMLIL
jgi:S-adenosylmethionine:tRNA ribosyltransferase-isomerase